jgi:hypothetical protein
MKIRVVMEMEVSDVAAADQAEFSEDGDEFVPVSDYSAEDIAEVLNTDEAPEMWEEHLAGSGVWAKIDRTTVISAEMINT